MVRYLLKHPIAVIMSFLACVILGAVTCGVLPVSLLPDIDIPKMTVQVAQSGTTARELENTVVAPVRRQLLQVGGLSDITSETRDGLGLIHLSFDFGTNTDLAFIEVNEKIDAAMSNLPKEVTRPKVIKAGAADLPVFYIHMTLRDDPPFAGGDEGRFLELCDLVEEIIKRRIEQLPQVAMADVTGIPGRQVLLTPHAERMEMYGVSLSDIENLLTANNVEPGNLTIRDGAYEYSVSVNTTARTPEELADLYLQSSGRLVRLGDLCDVQATTQRESGRSIYAGCRAITLAIIKQGDENMADLKREVQASLDRFAQQYPDVEFHISRNQTELLDYTISNLRQNLVLGLLFIFLIVYLFMGNVRSPLVIGLSMISSVVITFLFFYLFNVSMNIISLSGMIMAVGMMIDNAIIVTENIMQYREQGLTLMRAAARGTTEMIFPMLSSTLTTIVVFVPLVFISGIAGALFFDEAFTISVGLLVSYLVGIWLLPVLWVVIQRTRLRRKGRGRGSVERRSLHWMEQAYERGVNFTFGHKRAFVAGFVVTVVLCPLLFLGIRKERMPATPQHECQVRIAWNEPLHTAENTARVEALMAELQLLDLVSAHLEQSAYVGTTDFLLGGDNPPEADEAELYVDAGSAEGLRLALEAVDRWLANHYPEAERSVLPSETLFERIFTTGEADVEARLHSSNTNLRDDVPAIEALRSDISGSLRAGALLPKDEAPAPYPTRPLRILELNRARMLLYGVTYADLERTLKTAFRSNTVTTLRSYSRYMPIVVAGEEQTLEECLHTTLIETRADSLGRKAGVPLDELMRLRYSAAPRTIRGMKSGEYIPYTVATTTRPQPVVDSIRAAVRRAPEWNVDFAGGYVASARMMQELAVVLAVSLLLMFFILSAQFESFVLPLIVLLEIPIDTAFALALLWATGNTLNLMSAIGIIASCGVVINDSILKLDAIGTLHRGGMPMIAAIHEAGRRRLRPIVMTTLTTVLAMLPMLLTTDLGSAIQQPLAVAMIGTMTIGTLVSLFFIPLVYALVRK
jgi:multidrug efflux pump subunit AcrB